MQSRLGGMDATSRATTARKHHSCHCHPLPVEAEVNRVYDWISISPGVTSGTDPLPDGRVREMLVAWCPAGPRVLLSTRIIPYFTAYIDRTGCGDFIDLWACFSGFPVASLGYYEPISRVGISHQPSQDSLSSSQ